MVSANSAVASVAPGHAEEFPALTADSTAIYPETIAAGPDGNIWYADVGDKVARMTPLGAITAEYAIPAGPGANESPYGRSPYGIAVGADGNLWFTDANYDEQEHCFIGRITPDGTAVEFPLSPRYTLPLGIAVGPDDNMWFTERGIFSFGQPGIIGHITPAGTITESFVPASVQLSIMPQPSMPETSMPVDIALGADGNMWFTDDGSNVEGRNFIGKVTPAGKITEFPIPTPQSEPTGIALGPEGDMWFTEAGASQIGRITPAGSISEMKVPSAGGEVRSIVRGPEGDMWFSEAPKANALGRITPSGMVKTYSPIATGGDSPGSLAIGPDANLWFTEPESTKIGRFVLPAAMKNVEAPTISGQPVGGQALSASEGSWSEVPESVSYQWQTCDSSGGGCTDLNGEVTDSHFLTAQDVGHTLRAVVTAEAIGGTAVAVSAPSPIVEAAALAPMVPMAPSSSPLLSVGEYPIPATMTWTFAWTKTYTVVKALVVHGIPTGGYVETSCRGQGCAFTRRRSVVVAKVLPCHGPRCKKTRQKSDRGEVSLMALFKGRRLRAGANISVNVLAPGWIGKSFAFTVRANRAPRIEITCLSHQATDLSGKC